MKKHFRCIVCGDTHYGLLGPKVCPTCNQENVYVEAEEKETKLVTKAIEFEDHSSLADEWNYDIVKEKFMALCNINGQFVLNPDSAHTDMLLNGILKNQKVNFRIHMFWLSQLYRQVKQS